MVVKIDVYVTQARDLLNLTCHFIIITNYLHNLNEHKESNNYSIVKIDFNCVL